VHAHSFNSESKDLTVMKNKLLSLWQSTSVLNTLAAVLASLALVLLVLGASQWVKRHSLFNIKEVVVTGMRGQQDLVHQNPVFIKQAILRQLRGNLLTVELHRVQTAFAQAPWIRHVSVRRVWPNRLWVGLEEHQAVATMNDDYLVNQQGEAYMAVADDASMDLPILIGDRQDAPLMMQRYRELNQWLAPNKITVSRLFLSERRAWTAELSNKMTLEIGRDDLKPTANERVVQWAKTWATAQQATGTSNSLRIDLRYPNGYAISRPAS
jgi:cell division protein FtsQ